MFKIRIRITQVVDGDVGCVCLGNMGETELSMFVPLDNMRFDKQDSILPPSWNCVFLFCILVTGDFKGLCLERVSEKESWLLVYSFTNTHRRVFFSNFVYFNKKTSPRDMSITL